MSTDTTVHGFPLWQEVRIGKPPQVRELSLGFAPDRVKKVLLSFKFYMDSGYAKLDPAQAIVINNKIVPNLDIPHDKTSKLLEKVECKDVDVKALIKTSPTGEKNTVMVNYLMAPHGSLAAAVPGVTIGSLSLEIKVLTSDIPIPPPPPPNFKFCMWDGRSIPKDSVACPYCLKQPPQAGTDTKKCVNCGMLLPPQALFCEEFGHKQPVEPAFAKLCINVKCNNPLPAASQFCNICGTPQPASV